MREVVAVEGLKELDAALGEFKKSVAKGVLRRVGKKALEPIAETARVLAPKRTGNLADSIVVGTRLTKRQASLHRKTDRATVDVFIGPNDPAAVPQEFGWEGNAPNPFMRPAWDAGKRKVLADIRAGLAVEIDKTAKRAARKLARQAKK